MLTAIANTDHRHAELTAQVAELCTVIKTLQGTIEKQQCTINDLLRRLYGRRSEKLNPDQILMDELMIGAESFAQEAAIVPELPEVEPKRRGRSRHHGRKPFPEHLPHEEIIISVPEEEKICQESGLPRRLIGYEESKKLEYVPETLKVIVFKREKWGSPLGAEEEGVVIAPRPAAAVECMAGPGLVAHVAVSKFEDRLPLYRRERIFGREGVDVSRKTMAGWLCGLAQAVTPIVSEMARRILCGTLVHHDDTPVKMLDPGAGKTKETRLWAAIGGDNQQYVHFEFTKSRNKDGPVEFFKNYQGRLMCDEYGGYEGICARDDVEGLSCWAHGRRYFDKAKLAYPLEATEMLVMIQQLYRVEREHKESTDAQRHIARQEQSVPQLMRIYDWLIERRSVWLPKSPMATASEYVLKRWDCFTRYTEDPTSPIDNNVAERAIRAVAVGRKNWLFLGSENGGHTAATLMSLIGTCHHLGMNAWAYLNDVQSRLPNTSEADIPTLLPDVWRDQQLAEAD